MARALWYVAPGVVELRPEPLAARSADDVRIRTVYSGVSRGTEALVANGRAPPSEYDRMRAPFMAGDFPFPVKYGYASVGRIEDGPEHMRDALVFALYPHQDIFNINTQAVIAIPDTVPAHRAVLAANMETALNAVWDAAPTPADRITVVGGGVVGALVAFLCGRLPGAEVTLVDINPARAPLAGALGVGFALPDQAPEDCDLVVHASGSPAGLRTALRLGGQEATILEMSWYGDADVAIPLGEAFHSRRLRLVSSQVGQVAASHRPRWTHRRRLAAALSLLADDRLDVLLAPPIPFEDAPTRLPDVLRGAGAILCQALEYRPEAARVRR